MTSAIRICVELVAATVVLSIIAVMVYSVFESLNPASAGTTAADKQAEKWIRFAGGAGASDQLLIVRHDKTIELVDLGLRQSEVARPSAGQMVLSLSASSDQNRLLAVVEGGRLLYSAQPFTEEGNWQSLSSLQFVDQAILSADGSQALILRRGENRNIVESLDLGDDVALSACSIPFDDSEHVTRIALSPNGLWLLGVHTDHSWLVWNARTGQIVDRGTAQQEGAVHVVEWWPDSRGFVAGTYNGGVSSYSFNSRSIVWERSCDGTAIVKVSQPAGNRLAVTTVTGQAYLLNLGDGTTEFSVPSSGCLLRHLQIGEERGTLTTIDANGIIREWQIATHALLREWS